MKLFIIVLAIWALFLAGSDQSFSQAALRASTDSVAVEYDVEHPTYGLRDKVTGSFSFDSNMKTVPKYGYYGAVEYETVRVPYDYVAHVSVQGEYLDEGQNTMDLIPQILAGALFTTGYSDVAWSDTYVGWVDIMSAIQNDPHRPLTARYFRYRYDVAAGAKDRETSQAVSSGMSTGWRTVPLNAQ